MPARTGRIAVMERFRALWISLCLCVAAVSVSAETVFSIHPDHACTGAGCPVCLFIQRMENFCKQLKCAAVYPCFQPAGLLIIAFVLKHCFFLLIPLSAVRLKVKINR
jgi:hypothetical protein